ncbi:MAG: hypothetical protein V2I63_03385 [Pseudomonadales bacterium]|jgi:uncharacterized repeat protein (TIGR01451 family)|nr:hypothetical protein [Pseudomonadales bacterium]
MKTFLNIALLSLAAVAALGHALDDMRLVTGVQKVEAFVNEAGERSTRLVEAASVVPGDELRYTVTFANEGAEVVDAGTVVITNPVPDNTVYLDGSAFGAGTAITFSIDGATFASAEELFVTEPDGARRLARPEEYTHVRWTFAPALEPGE